MKLFAKSVCLVVLLMVPGNYAYAGSALENAAEKMLLATHADQKIHSFEEQIQTMIEEQNKRLHAPESAKPIISEYKGKMLAAMEKELSWNAIKSELIAVYTKDFNEEELNKITAFYSTPLGEKYITKTPELLKSSYEISQKRIKKVMPEIQQLFHDMQVEVAKVGK